MKVVYNKHLGGWQIIHLACWWKRPSCHGRPVNDKVYPTEDDAWIDIDRWAE